MAARVKPKKLRGAVRKDQRKAKGKGKSLGQGGKGKQSRRRSEGAADDEVGQGSQKKWRGAYKQRGRLINRRGKFKTRQTQHKQVDVGGRGSFQERAKANEPPKGDADEVGASVPAAALPAATKMLVAGEEPKKKKFRKEKENKTSAEPTPTKPLKLPDQRPGESARSYARRLDRCVRERLRPVSRKMTTEKQRLRRKAHGARRLARGRAKRASGDEGSDCEKGPPNKRSRVQPKFGDVVKQPPCLRRVPRKSGGRPVASDKPSFLKAVNLESYAAQVREAYSAIKRRRQGGESTS